MKKCWFISIFLCFLLSGCAAAPVFEYVRDTVKTPGLPAPAQVTVAIPEEAVAAVMQNGEAGTLYLCDRYTVTVQTCSGGDLNATVQAVTGYGSGRLSLVETACSQGKRYDCAWASAGEAGDQVGRAAILDDGAYHYVVTLMTDAPQAGGLAETWQAILDSVSLNTET